MNTRKHFIALAAALLLVGYFMPQLLSVPPETDPVRYVWDMQGQEIGLTGQQEQALVRLLSQQKEQRTLSPVRFSPKQDWTYCIRLPQCTITVEARKAWVYWNDAAMVHRLWTTDEFYTQLQTILQSVSPNA